MILSRMILSKILPLLSSVTFASSRQTLFISDFLRIVPKCKCPASGRIWVNEVAVVSPLDVAA